ncbi:MAG: MBL fold metallo-hydrolase [Bacilli bacterium]
MRFYVLASGSKGNATLVVSQDKCILIDLGITYKCLCSKLSEISYSINDIHAILFTHDHADHIGGVCNKIDMKKCYCAKGTLEIDASNELSHYGVYNIDGFKITILPTSHDAINPVGFVIEADGEKLVYMTDTGYVSTRNFEYMKNADHYIMESNYNYKMLMQTNRPESLKLRIIGDSGHLSNEDSAATLCQLVGEKTKNICLAHISREANTKDLALETCRSIFNKYNVSLEHINLIAADQFITLTFGEEVYEN